MCDPATGMAVASLGIGVGQSVLGFGQASQQAARQNAFYQQNAMASERAMVNAYSGEITQETQERNAASTQEFQNEINGARGAGTAVTAAGQAGVGGLSVNELLGDYIARTSRQNDAVSQNYAMTDNTLRNQMTATHDETLARINSVQTATPPSPLMLGLGIANAGVSAYGNYVQDRYMATRGMYNPQTDSNLGGFG